MIFQSHNLLILEYSTANNNKKISFLDRKYLKMHGASGALPLDPTRGLRTASETHLHFLQFVQNVIFENLLDKAQHPSILYSHFAKSSHSVRCFDT